MINSNVDTIVNFKNGVHISKINPKTAEVLAKAHMVDDIYHNNIKESAKRQVQQGNPKSVYGGQRVNVWWHTEADYDVLVGG